MQLVTHGLGSIPNSYAHTAVTGPNSKHGKSVKNFVIDSGCKKLEEFVTQLLYLNKWNIVCMVLECQAH